MEASVPETHNEVDRDSKSTVEERVFKNIAVGDMGDVIQSVEAHQLDVNIRDAYGNTLLHWAAYRGNLELTNYFIDHGADVSPANIKDAHTPLHWAALNGEQEIVQVLLDKGALVDPADKNGHTPLFFAVDNNKPLVAHYLICLGANVMSQDNSSRTPLHMAAGKGLVGVGTLLLSHGAIIDAQDALGNTPLHYAAQHNHLDFFGDFLRIGANYRLPNNEGKEPVDLGDKVMQNFMNTKVKDTPESFLKKPEYSPQRITRWCLYAFVAHMFVLFILANWGFVAGALAAALCIGIISKILKWPKYDERNPFFASLSVSTFFTMLYFIITKILPRQQEWGILVYLHLFAALALFLSFWNLILLKTDPGNINVPVLQDFREMQRDIKEGAPISLCAICKVRRPLRSKHVRQTDKCVARFDHYCDWIGNAVGAHNHRPFLAYLFFVVFHCALYLYMSYDALPSSNEVTVLKQIYEILQDDRVFSITIFKSIFFCLAMGMQLFQQLHFAAVNLTVNEALNGRRYSHFWVNGRWFNPFSNGGYLGNTKEFFFPTIDWKRVFYLRDLPNGNEIRQHRQQEV